MNLDQRAIQALVAATAHCKCSQDPTREAAAAPASPGSTFRSRCSSGRRSLAGALGILALSVALSAGFVRTATASSSPGTGAGGESADVTTAAVSALVCSCVAG